MWPWITALFDLGLRSDNFCETLEDWTLHGVAGLRPLSLRKQEC